MRYALNCCQQVDLGDSIRFVGRCVFTGKIHSVVVSKESVEKYIAGALIQDACPDLSANQREFLLSGVSPAVWSEMFGEE